jgi:hypothetical protein
MAKEPKEELFDNLSEPSEENEKIGRPATLDERKRRQIIAIVANGSSRRVAARVVGCSHSTIRRTAERDPTFAAELDAAEQTLEVEALQSIRAAAKDSRYWRAAAWLLERKHPRDFARRDLGSLTEDDVLNLWRMMSDPLIQRLTDEEYDEMQDRMYETARALHECDELTKYLPIPEPPPPVYVARNTPVADPTPAPPPLECPVNDCAVCPHALTRVNGPGANGLVCELLLTGPAEHFQPHQQDAQDQYDGTFAPQRSKPDDAPAPHESSQFVAAEGLTTTSFPQSPTH